MKLINKILLAAHLPILMSSFFYNASAQSDSLALDSLPNANIKLFPIPKNHGSIFNLKNEALKIHKTEPQEINYISIHKVIYEKTLSQPLFTNNFGKRDRFGFFGYFHNATTINGIQQYGPGLSGFSFWTSPAEGSENIEIYEGAEAIPFAQNSGGVLINFQEISYNSKKPFVRIWGSDINDDLLNFEGTWAQNFSPNWNFYANYRSMSGQARYQNSNFRSRNLRLGFRNTIDSFSQINYTYIHSNNFVTSNSGINPALSIDVEGNFTDSPVNSIVHFNSLNRRNKDHQIIAHYSNKFDSTGKKAMNASFYSKYSIIHENLGDLDFNESEDIEKFNNFITGGNFSYEIMISNIFIKAIADLNYMNFQENKNYGLKEYLNYSLGGFLSVNNKSFKPYVSIRSSNNLGNNFLDFGGGIELKIFNLPLKLDYSFSHVTPAFYQFEADLEKHSLFLVKTNFKLFNSNLSINLWNRSITDQIIYGVNLTNNEISDFNYLNDQNLNISGASVQIDFLAAKNSIFNYDNIFINLKIITNPFVIEGRSPFPLIFGDLMTYINIPRGKSEANIGFTWKLASPVNGYGFNDFYDIYYVDPYQELPSMLANIEFFARMRLNHAWLKLSFVNPLGSDIYYLSHHRSLNQFFKLSFNWTIN